jgi:succinylornithine transaminase family protein
LWDQQGKDYLDFAGGIAVSALGHAYPPLVKRLQQQAAQLWHVSNVMTNEPALRLAYKLCQATFAEKVFFANSGAEANEAALKLVRKYSFDKNKSHEKSEIIAFTNSFHGRTLFTVTAGGQPKYSEPFAPLPGGIQHLPYNDLAAFEQAISDRTCGVIIEPIQGEGGIIPVDKAFIQGVRAACDRHQALLIFDEVQTGMGRTGDLYAYMGLGVTPDILTSAKALGCGFPMGAMLTTSHIAQSFNFGSHGSTGGGNPLACAVGELVLDTINDPQLLAGVKAKHDLLIKGLKAMNQRYPLFTEFRGAGLLLGAKEVLLAALEQGLLVLVAGPNVVRFAPALVISEQEIDQGLQRFEQALASLTG